ncbi:MULTISPECIES: hypothetical protein [unclassified Microcystis]|nr:MULTISPECIES: hypothetical protein [unclassified Microcystis]
MCSQQSGRSQSTPETSGRNLDSIGVAPSRVKIGDGVKAFV